MSPHWTFGQPAHMLQKNREMDMPDKTENANPLAGLIATGKDLVALLRDALLLLLGMLLLLWPASINSMLVAAGFEEGSFAGLQWKARLTQSDGSLVKAQALIADLKDQNLRLGQALSQTRPPDSGPASDSLERINQALTAKADRVQSALTSSLAANSELVQKAQPQTAQATTWGVVYGGDRTLADARHETGPVASKLGLTGATIYLRQGSYRSVVTSSDRLQAAQLLKKAQERRADAYLVDMASWCQDPAQQDGYLECPAP